MNMKKIVLSGLIVLGTSAVVLTKTVNPTKASVSFEPANKIAVTVTPNIEFVNDAFRYSYKVDSQSSSLQNVWVFGVEYLGNINNNNIPSLNNPIPSPVKNIISPNGWDGIDQFWQSNLLGWAAVGDPVQDLGSDSFNIKPNSSQEGFKFDNLGLPHISKYYAQGYTDIPVMDEDASEADLKELEDKADFMNNNVSGYTVGAGVDPTTLTALQIITTLIAEKSQAVTSGWLNQAVISTLDGELNGAMVAISSGQNELAETLLNNFITTLNTQKGQSVSLNAYNLLKPTAQYLIEKKI